MSQGRILVQCDWNHVYREGGGQFWISYKCSGEPSIYSHVFCEKQIDGNLKLSSENTAFRVDSHSNNQLKISYTPKQCTTKFRSPYKEYIPHGKVKKVTCLDVTNGGLGLSCAESCTTIKIWETSTGKVRRELSGHVGDVYTAKFFPSGVVILSAGVDTQLKIWSAETGSCAATMTGHRAGVTEVEFVEKGRNVVSCSRDGMAKLWDVSQQKCIHTYGSEGGLGAVNSCSVHQTQAIDLGETFVSDEEVNTEGKLLLLGLESGKLQAFGLNTKKQLFEVMPPDAGAANCIKFLTDRSFVFGSQEGVVGVYDLRQLSQPLKLIREGRSAVQSVSPFQHGFLYSTADGSSVYVDETLCLNFDLSGADCDPVYQVVHTNNDIYTSCRDGLIRVYNV